ncbi:MAG: thioredoxin domain-containing protein [Anaerolineae bacterium]|nr:thioredoxin domain-containing protein [Anaerolineae bacterium]
MANHLAGEASRYLQQHADNPVDWHPWGEVALAKARAEGKPIFLSIGYSACHWCHVMAHESFEDAETAAFLNAAFVSIKVDREERPDLDRIYMGAVQALTGGGGWPMSVFTTPEGEPFYGGTYFPKTPRYGMPSFLQVLHAIADAWENRREELVAGGQKLVSMLRHEVLPGGDSMSVDPDTAESAYEAMAASFDNQNGGWGSAPKFPQSMALEFLLRRHHVTGDARALAMVAQTLEAMARGGIYDQLGGGFHRYAVDARWVTPHFEKMLYDNALLARVYLHAGQAMSEKVTGDRDPDSRLDSLARLFLVVAEETLDYVMREMTSPEGGFYATQDADTDGEEGKAYTWTSEEIRSALGGPAARLMSLYGVTESGNFDGKSILTFGGTVREREALAGARRLLLAARGRRSRSEPDGSASRPGRDEKVLTSWNGLMLAAFAEAARVLERDDYRQLAERNAHFLLRGLRAADGRLRHVWYDGEASVQGLLEDYAYLVEGLIALYETTFEARWVVAARELADEMIAHFGAWSDDGERIVGFYDTADDAGSLVIRPRENQDNAVPSGSAMAATVLLKLGRLWDEACYEDIAVRSLGSMQSLLVQHPLGFGQWLVALDSATAATVEVAIVGDVTAKDTRALVGVAQGPYAPHRLVVAGPGPVPGLLAHREQVSGRATAYVCRNRACLPPVTEPDRLREMLA